MRVTIDTNIVLDYALEREPFARTAIECLERLPSQKARMYLSASVVSDIYYISRQNLHNAAAARKIIEALLAAFHIIPVDGADCQNALTVGVNDYEDALVAVCAKKVKADYIITRNTKHFAASPVPAVTPEELSEQL